MYREVTMIEIQEVLRLRGKACPRSGSPPSSGSIQKRPPVSDGRSDRRHPRQRRHP